MPYDISEAFEKIEDELIGSMIRNLDRHKAEETERGYRWEQWQAVQLKALEDYHRNNREKFPERFNKLNQQIREVLQDSYNDGSTKQERKLLQAVKRGFKGESGTNAPAFTGQTETTGEFFKVNDRKLDALITAATHDMERAETAVLRKADDQYRRIIFNAQVYANTGAGTYEKAVDMATKDFLRAGINCIEYKNGSRHTITDYADMAIRTAAKRAYLQGEGAKRQEQGIPTVILNKRSNACPLCTPFCGKVFIDDVWSGGDKSGISPVTGAKYPLLSDAIAQGLYHPRCQDSHTTYFEGINTAPDDSEYTKEELDAMAEKYNAEQKQAYCERQEKRYSRMSEYSLDPDNKRMYKARAEEWSDRKNVLSNIIDRVKYTTNYVPKVEKQFTDRLPMIKNKKFSSIIGAEHQKRKITKSSSKNIRRSYFSPKTGNICVGITADGSTLAHELMHGVDDTYHFTQNGYLKNELSTDFQKIQKKAKNYGQSVENMLLSIYPKAFKSNGKMKEEYRGISDIFSGLSMNKINFGYGHSKKYWVKVGNLEKETFAQYGRFYFEENPDVLDIIKKLFPETTKAMNNAIDVISSNKYK